MPRTVGVALRAFGVVSRIGSGFLADRIGGIRTLLIGSVAQGSALLFYLFFDGRTEDFATEMFVIINSTPTRINKSHLVDLYEKVSWSAPDKRVADGLEVGATNLSTKLIFTQLSYLGIVVVPLTGFENHGGGTWLGPEGVTMPLSHAGCRTAGAALGIAAGRQVAEVGQAGFQLLLRLVQELVHPLPL